jgi:hypothetical protein
MSVINNENRGHWMQTRSGRKFYPEDPRPEDIDIEDIAHALSLVNRFGGHTPEPYSVAQHSVLVANEVERRSQSPHPMLPAGGWRPLILWGLLHDASEAYLGDIVWPLKQASLMQGYKVLEANVMTAIVERFALLREEPAIVKACDLTLLATEKRDVMCESGRSLSEHEARTMVEAEVARERTGEWHSDHVEPLPTRIVVWQARAAREEFLRRYRELEGSRT